MIGVYDSGIGGLAVLARLRRRFPRADLLYFGDTAHLPYGDQPIGAIRRYAEGAISFLRREGASAILVACGTVSTTLIEPRLISAELPILGVVSPAVKAVARHSPRRVAVLATQATCRSGVFGMRLRERLGGAQILELACPAFVPLIEAGVTDASDRALLALLRRELRPCLDFDPDAILLGCTHYVLLGRALARLFPRARIVDAGSAAAGAIPASLGRGSGETRYRVSGDTALFCRAAAQILLIEPSAVKRVCPCEY